MTLNVCFSQTLCVTSAGGTDASRRVGSLAARNTKPRELLFQPANYANPNAAAERKLQASRRRVRLYFVRCVASKDDRWMITSAVNPSSREITIYNMIATPLSRPQELAASACSDRTLFITRDRLDSPNFCSMIGISSWRIPASTSRKVRDRSML